MKDHEIDECTPDCFDASEGINVPAKRKSAEDVARKLADRFGGMTFSGGLGTEWLVSEIAQALTAFAYDRVEIAKRNCVSGSNASYIAQGRAEALKEQTCCWDPKSVCNIHRGEVAKVRAEGYTEGCTDTIHNSPMFEEGIKEGRLAALEDAAKIADKEADDLETDMSWKYCGEKVAKRIRALK